ncbi:MAG TPA: hypothetical protein VF384_17835 [Planctomycetota bacterium]
MKLFQACTLLVLATTLSAQSVGVSLSALTPLQTVVANGAAINTATWPAGPLTSYHSFGATLPGPSAPQATVFWSFLGWNNHAFVELLHSLANPGAVPTVTATTGSHEFLAELTATAPVSADIRISRVDHVVAGAVSPTVQLDYDNDGTIDVASVSTASPLLLTRQYGPQPFRVRIVVNASLSGVEHTSTHLTLEATPHNDLTITEVIAPCFATGPFPPSVQPSFFGRGVTLVAAQYAGTLGLVVVGFSPQPALLGSSSGLPCILLPSPDIVLVTSGLEVPLPASLRPLTFFAQGVTWTPNGLLTNEGFAVTAF